MPRQADAGRGAGGGRGIWGDAAALVVMVAVLFPFIWLVQKIGRAHV